MKNIEVSSLQGASKNISLQNYTSGPIYRKINDVRTKKVLSIASHALDRNALDHGACA
jgi:hypothetical protein